MNRLTQTASLMLLLCLTGCAASTSTSGGKVTLAQLEALRVGQQAYRPAFSGHYPQNEIALPTDTEKQLHQFLAQQDPSAITVSVGNSAGDPLQSARIAHQRLKYIEKMLTARAIDVSLQYKPDAEPDSLNIEVGRE